MKKENAGGEMDKGPGLHGKVFDPRRSSFQKYCDIYVGRKGIVSFLRYELTILLFGQLPGAVGFFLRKTFYPSLFQKVGRNVIFASNITLRHPHKISLGTNVIIDANCVLDAKGGESSAISVGDNVTIGRNSALICKDGRIKIGSGVNITTYVNIGCGEKGNVEIGNNVEIGSFTHFSGRTYDIGPGDVLPSARGSRSKGVIVEDLVWIGARVTILDGVRIGTKSVIGAGSVVTKEIPPNCVAFGVPARGERKRVDKQEK